MKKNHFWGYFAEWFAILWLFFKGYRLHRYRYMTPVGEIDLIMRRREMWVFVEVKWRRNKENFSKSWSFSQRKRLHKAAQWFLMHQRKSIDPSVQFDAIFLCPWRIKHVKNIHPLEYFSEC
jgi:putative endonuclease